MLFMEDVRREGDAARLLAESGLHGYPFASLGATARQHRLAGLGLHAGPEPVGLAPPAAVRLKRTFRHPASALLLENFA
jgi:hypothetical protein